jgi:hypothetical protein
MVQDSSMTLCIRVRLYCKVWHTPAAPLKTQASAIVMCVSIVLHFLRTITVYQVLMNILCVFSSIVHAPQLSQQRLSGLT